MSTASCFLIHLNIRVQAYQPKDTVFNFINSLISYITARSSNLVTPELPCFALPLRTSGDVANEVLPFVDVLALLVTLR